MFYSTNFDKNLKNNKFLSVFLFYILSFFIFGLWMSGEIIFKRTPELRTKILLSLDEIENNYPDDLIINWDREKLNINREQINLAYPSWFDSDQDLPQYFISYSQEDLKPSSFIIFNNQEVSVSNLRGKYSSLALKETPGFEEKFTISKDSLPQQMGIFKEKFQNNFNDLKIIFPILFAPIFVMFSLVGLLVDTMLVFLFIRIFDRLDFKYVLKISLQVAVIAGLIERISSTIYGQNHYPLFSISYYVLIFFIFWKNKRNQV